MSRTKKGAKPVGFEYWAARPFNNCGGFIGAYTKKRTHKAERAEQKKQTREVLTPVSEEYNFL